MRQDMKKRKFIRNENKSREEMFDRQRSAEH